jgi:hypothetical protein
MIPSYRENKTRAYQYLQQPFYFIQTSYIDGRATPARPRCIRDRHDTTINPGALTLLSRTTRTRNGNVLSRRLVDRVDATNTASCIVIVPRDIIDIVLFGNMQRLVIHPTPIDVRELPERNRDTMVRRDVDHVQFPFSVRKNLTIVPVLPRWLVKVLFQCYQEFFQYRSTPSSCDG